MVPSATSLNTFKCISPQDSYLPVVIQPLTFCFNCLTVFNQLLLVLEVMAYGTLNRPRRRRLEAFLTDAKIIRLISRRVAIFSTAAARQFFDGDCNAADLKKFLGDTRGSPTL